VPLTYLTSMPLTNTGYLFVELFRVYGGTPILEDVATNGFLVRSNQVINHIK